MCRGGGRAFWSLCQQVELKNKRGALGLITHIDAGAMSYQSGAYCVIGLHHQGRVSGCSNWPKSAELLSVLGAQQLTGQVRHSPSFIEQAVHCDHMPRVAWVFVRLLLHRRSAAGWVGGRWAIGDLGPDVAGVLWRGVNCPSRLGPAEEPPLAA